MIHYHGTPLTPRSELYKLAGKHFCVSYAHPGDADVCAMIGQSVMFDNGAFSAFTKDRAFDAPGYYRWLEPHGRSWHEALRIRGEMNADRKRRWEQGEKKC